MKFSNQYEELFEEAAFDFYNKIKGKNSNSQKKYTLFYPMIGKTYEKKREIFFVGRAPNGWGVSWVEDSNLKEKVMDSREWSIENDDKCPINWVNEYWYTSNVRHSSFWRVIYKVIMAKYGDDDKSWCERIAWSNLYKISPASGNNPTEKECRRQIGYASKLIDKEIEELKPRNVVFITGDTWIEDVERDFLQNVEIDWLDDDIIKGLGRYGNSKIIITRRPEGIKQMTFIDSLIKNLD